MLLPQRGRTLFHLAAISGIGLFLSSCAPGNPYLLQGKYPGGAWQYSVETDSLGRKNGVEHWWHPNGTMKSEATWRAGIRDGAYRAWYANGKPWYAGRDSLGIPVDTLRFWHPNGQLHTLSVYVGGEPVSLDEYDSAGVPSAATWVRLEAARQQMLEADPDYAGKRRADSLAAIEAARSKALREWSGRVRASVEPWWSLPEALKKVPRRATARLRVARDGSLLGVTWTEKSGSKDFDAQAARALTKVRKLPAVPLEVAAPLDLSYAFTTPGITPPRQRLQLKNPDAALDDSARAGGL
ncbi:MAG TPA: TonB C-terminal domain-containing protein [Fibrobacteria bacterium]|jgi:hypothetical protein|nr:TonB C-terminal domain-containing protein [Fibrobacteria bacterium]